MMQLGISRSQRSCVCIALSGSFGLVRSLWRWHFHSSRPLVQPQASGGRGLTAAEGSSRAAGDAFPASTAKNRASSMAVSVAGPHWLEPRPHCWGRRAAASGASGGGAEGAAAAGAKRQPLSPLGVGHVGRTRRRALPGDGRAASRSPASSSQRVQVPAAEPRRQRGGGRGGGIRGCEKAGENIRRCPPGPPPRPRRWRARPGCARLRLVAPVVAMASDPAYRRASAGSRRLRPLVIARLQAAADGVTDGKSSIAAVQARLLQLGSAAGLAAWRTRHMAPAMRIAFALLALLGGAAAASKPALVIYANTTITKNGVFLPVNVYNPTPDKGDVVGVYQYLGESDVGTTTNRAVIKFFFPAARDASYLKNNHTYIIAKSPIIVQGNPNEPTQGHVGYRSITDQNVAIQWTTRDYLSPVVQWGLSADKMTYTVPATPSTYARAEMCGPPANTTGWRDPGTFNTAFLSLPFKTRFGVDSSSIFFRPPPSPGNAPDPTNFARWFSEDQQVINSDQEEQGASLATANALYYEAYRTGLNYNALFISGDISYARGFQGQWEQFWKQTEGITQRVPVMITMGNHERDWPGTGDRFSPYPPLDLDSGLPYIVGDLQSVNRSKTPWVIISGHRPIHIDSLDGVLPSSNLLAGEEILANLEDVFMLYQVDLILAGHHHTYQRTFPVYKRNVTATGPVYVVAGNAGFQLTLYVQPTVPDYFAVVEFKHGFLRFNIDATTLQCDCVSVENRTNIIDTFTLTKPVNFKPNPAGQAAIIAQRATLDDQYSTKLISNFSFGRALELPVCGLRLYLHQCREDDCYRIDGLVVEDELEPRLAVPERDSGREAPDLLEDALCCSLGPAYHGHRHLLMLSPPTTSASSLTRLSPFPHGLCNVNMRGVPCACRTRRWKERAPLSADGSRSSSERGKPLEARTLDLLHTAATSPAPSSASVGRRAGILPAARGAGSRSQSPESASSPPPSPPPPPPPAAAAELAARGSVGVS
eukprot:SM000156S02134  [mRNA]  locus=s156:167665:178237:+ [translate_table: standard]